MSEFRAVYPTILKMGTLDRVFELRKPYPTVLKMERDEVGFRFQFNPLKYANTILIKTKFSLTISAHCQATGHRENIYQIYEAGRGGQGPFKNHRHKS